MAVTYKLLFDENDAVVGAESPAGEPIELSEVDGTGKPVEFPWENVHVDNVVSIPIVRTTHIEDGTCCRKVPCGPKMCWFRC